MVQFAGFDDCKCVYGRRDPDCPRRADPRFLPSWALPLYAPRRLKSLRGGRSSGKALRHDTPIATPEGWTTIGELRSGDTVFDPFGQPCRVRGVYPQGPKRMYRVDFRRGESIHADAEHLWVTADANWRKRCNRRGMRSYEGWQLSSPITTSEMAASLRKETGRRDLNHAIPVAAALELPARNLPVDPYVLGVWLGDGMSSAPVITCVPDDAAHYRRMFAERGERIHDAPWPSTEGDVAPAYPVSRGGTFRRRLRGLMGAWKRGNKHIPPEYLRASREQRLALLAGLMDTDGTVDRSGRHMEFVSCNRRLTEGVAEIVTSLGRRTAIWSKPAKIDGRTVGTAYIVGFAPIHGAVTLPRKVARICWETKVRNRRIARMVTAVEDVGEIAEAVCIAVDSPSRMFLAGRSMIPTHNTYSFGQAFVRIMAGEVAAYQRGGYRLMVTREFEKSIRESAQQVLRIWIDRLGYSSRFRITHDHITCPSTGGYITFSGIERNRQSIRGWESYDFVWVEEAHRLTDPTWEILEPTMRAGGSEIWMSWNPHNRYDVAWREAVTLRKLWGDDMYSRWVNWQDLPPCFVSAETYKTIQRFKAAQPERYPHVYEGFPDDAGAERKIMPYRNAQAAVDTFRPEYVDGLLQAGLDLADTGTDWNALVIRRGPCVLFVERWRAPFIGDTVRRAVAKCVEYGVQFLYYDVGGLGAAARSHLRDAKVQDRLGQIKSRPINFGSAVTGKGIKGRPGVYYTQGHTNEQFFARRGSQLWWALKMRADNTLSLSLDHVGLASTTARPELAFYVAPGAVRGMPEEQYLAELSQPVWDTNIAGKVEVDKQPKLSIGGTEPPSPDMAEATALAFARDSRTGLRAHAIAGKPGRR